MFTETRCSNNNVTVFLCTEQEATWGILRKSSTMPAGRVMAPHRLGPPDRGYGVVELSQGTSP